MDGRFCWKILLGKDCMNRHMTHMTMIIGDRFVSGYCLWVGLRCLAVFLWPPFDALPTGSALGSGAVAADQGTVKTKSRLGAVSGQSSWCCIEGEPIWSTQRSTNFLI